MACLVDRWAGKWGKHPFPGNALRYDYNVAGTAAVNYLETRKDVDKERLGVMGISLGGYYAPRCAAFEKRYKACVAWGAIYDYYATWKSRIEKAVQGIASPFPANTSTGYLGVKSYDEALKKLEKFTLKGVAGKIACPFLLVHGEADAQITREDAQKLFDEVGFQG